MLHLLQIISCKSELHLSPSRVMLKELSVTWWEFWGISIQGRFEVLFVCMACWSCVSFTVCAGARCPSEGRTARRSLRLLKRGPLPWTESRDSQRLCASHAGREEEDGSAFHRAEPHHLPDSLSHCLLEDSVLSRQTFWPCYAKNSFVSWLSVHAVLFHPGPVTLCRSDFCFHDALLTNKLNLLINIFPSSPVGALCRELLKGKARQTANKKP